MFPPVMKAHKGMARAGPIEWRVEELDPQFIFKFNLFSARYFIIEILSSDKALEPCFYMDVGYGFRPEYEITFPTTQHGIYIIRRRARLRRLRFDPCSDRGDFVLRLRTASTLKSARKAGSASDCSMHLIDARDQIQTPPPARIDNPEVYFDSIIKLSRAHFAAADRKNAEVAPVISFVCPVYNTSPNYLDALSSSFETQSVGNWELLLCDDGSSSTATLAWLDRHGGHPRIKVLRNPQREGIAGATNLGVFAAQGEWVGFIDHDDALAPFAIEHLNQAIVDRVEAEFIYTDEVIADAKLKPTGFFFKPAFDPVLLSGVNYINHLSLYRRRRLVGMGGLRLGYDGSQDYELLLRYLAGLPATAIVHLPYPAYLWRRDGNSFSASFAGLATANARRALGAAYADQGGDCLVEAALVPDLHRLRLDRRRDAWPAVSIIVPNRDGFELIDRLLTDLMSRTDYPHLEIIVVDNGTTDPRVLQLYEALGRSHANFHVDLTVEPFNFARQINKGLRRARGDALLLLNNDIEVHDSGWLKEMVACLDYPETGIVGARLLYPSGKIQHAGVILGLSGLAGHWFAGSEGITPGPMNRLKVRQSFSAVTGACMLISRPCYEATGEWDETIFAVAFNDIDYCLRAALSGFRAAMQSEKLQVFG